MAHYSEMDFLFSNKVNNDTIAKQLNKTNDNNQFNIFSDSSTRVIYKSDNNTVGNTASIKNYLQTRIYRPNSKQNPYVELISNFDIREGTPGAGLRIKAADLSYLRDLGVYPINRMVILRRFKEGRFLSEDLNEMTTEPVSTVIGWLKPDQNFGIIGFSETWGKTTERFDVLMARILKERFNLDIGTLIPVPAFAQGLLFELYKQMQLTQGANYRDDDVEDSWGLNSIPVGDPNLLMEGPFRDPDSQNIQSNFTFEFETTYEQKFIGDVDPGSAMMDIIDNIFAMGTSNMKFYWADSLAMKKAGEASSGAANDPQAWWTFVKDLMVRFWEAMKEIFKSVKDTIEKSVSLVANAVQNKDSQALANEFQKTVDNIGTIILTSTVAIFRYQIRGSIELMTGSKQSSTPWYLTIGNPYAPWLASNHIIVNGCSIETSTELGFNDQPQWVKAKFTCQFSRALGRQELMRMLNNTFKRNYGDPLKIETKTNITNKPANSGSNSLKTRINNIEGLKKPGNITQEDLDSMPAEERLAAANMQQGGKTFYSKGNATPTIENLAQKQAEAKAKLPFGSFKI